MRYRILLTPARAARAKNWWLGVFTLAVVGGERPFVVVNCAAVPGELLESELFGHEQGSYTGASQARLGRFRKADGGTIFLDEVGEVSLELQSKLLRVLQDYRIAKYGLRRG